MVTFGAFSASTASAHEGGESTRPHPFKRIAHFTSEGNAWQSVVNPQHIERMAEHLDMTVEELQALLETEDGRETVQTQLKAMFEERRQEHLETFASELDMTVEELQAAKDDPEAREAIRERMQELGIQPPERHGHPRTFGQLRSRLN